MVQFIIVDGLSQDLAIPELTPSSQILANIINDRYMANIINDRYMVCLNFLDIRILHFMKILL